MYEFVVAVTVEILLLASHRILENGTFKKNEHLNALWWWGVATEII